MAASVRVGNKKPRIFYGWFIVIAGIILLSLGYGSRYSYSVFFPTVVAEFGWHRDLAGSILSFHLICYGLTAPLSGFLVDRIGPKKSMLIGSIIMTLGMALSGLSTKPWHFYVTFGLLAGFGLCLVASVPLTVVVRNWFERRRGTAISLFFFGEGVAYAWYPAVVWLIDALGWRKAISLEGLIVGAVFIPLVTIVMVSRPELKGLHKDGLDPAQATPDQLDREERRIIDRAWADQDWSLGRALKTWRFYMICITSFSIWGLSHHVLVTHQIALAIDAGYERMYASAVISIGGVTFALGCLLGTLSDKIGREWSVTLGTVLEVTGIAAAMAITDTSAPWLLYYYAIAFGLGFGICVPVVAAAATDLFQGPRAGATIGAIWVSFSLGGALGPWLGGWMFEVSGNYQTAFGVAALACLIGCLTLWLAGPRRVRLAPGRVKGLA